MKEFKKTPLTFHLSNKNEKLTTFQWKVLKATLKIPIGETRTYQWIAQQIGHPGSCRAVGQALRRNPYPLIVPCHRVVKSDGSLGAYAGKNDSRKADLLALEKKLAGHLFSK